MIFTEERNLQKMKEHTSVSGLRIHFFFQMIDRVANIDQTGQLSNISDDAALTLRTGRGIFSHLGTQGKPSHWGPPRPCTALTKVLFSPQRKVFKVGSSK